MDEGSSHHNPDLLDRARAFAQAASHTALKIAPLAMAAVSLRADAILDYHSAVFLAANNQNVTVMETLVPTVSQLPSVGGVQGIAYSGGAADFTVSAQSGTLSPSGLGFFATQTYADSNYTGGDPVKISYDFAFTSTGDATVNGVAIDLLGFNQITNLANGNSGEISGSIETVLPEGFNSGGFAMGNRFELEIVDTNPSFGTSGGTIHLDVRELSISGVDQTPEPAPFALAFAGLVGLFCWRKRHTLSKLPKT